MDGFALKKVLSDLVEYAYPDHPKMTLLKGFYVQIEPQKKRRFHGQYIPGERKIRLVNLNRDNVRLTTTAVHELAHHADHVLNSGRGHQASFYAEYKTLMFAAMDMGLFTKEEVETYRTDTRDRNKVHRMIQQYRSKGEPVYKHGEKRIDVTNAYEIKDFLKRRGYSFDNILKSWYKEIEAADESLEVQALERLIRGKGISYTVSNAAELNFHKQSATP